MQLLLLLLLLDKIGVADSF